MLVILYLFSIVAANLVVGRFGPSSVLVVSFVLIGFDITLRDRLHVKWHKSYLRYKMMILILVGSVLSYILNREVQSIAIASFVAFFVATVFDTLVFGYLYRRSFFIRSNASNVVSAILDSSIFIFMAFGPLWLLMVKQIIVKILGGFLWSIILKKKI